MLDSVLSNNVAVGLLAAAAVPLGFTFIVGRMRSFVCRSDGAATTRRRWRGRRLSSHYAPPTWTSSAGEG